MDIRVVCVIYEPVKGQEKINPLLIMTITLPIIIPANTLRLSSRKLHGFPTLLIALVVLETKRKSSDKSQGNFDKSSIFHNSSRRTVTKENLGI